MFIEKSQSQQLGGKVQIDTKDMLIGMYGLHLQHCRAQARGRPITGWIKKQCC